MKKNMLITGGTGFLGRRLGRFFKERYDVVLAGRNHDQNRLAQTFSGCRVVPIDVASIESVRDVFSETRPSVVVHAAASKYVDVAEAHPMECIDVNVLGSQNVMRVAIDKGVETVIGVSTDKAAPPVANTYGLTKALMERMLCGMDGKTSTKFACVRFGNLPWSTGSVFPVWKRMQETSGIIGTTGPEMFRFFNPAEEAVELVNVVVNSIEVVHGNILCQKMKAAKIGDILNVWIKQKGGTWSRIPGRPGERDHEFMVGEAEAPYASEAMVGGIKMYVISPHTRAANGLAAAVSSENAEVLSEPEIINIINNPPEDIS